MSGRSRLKRLIGVAAAARLATAAALFFTSGPSSGGNRTGARGSAEDPGAPVRPAEHDRTRKHVAQRGTGESFAQVARLRGLVLSAGSSLPGDVRVEVYGQEASQGLLGSLPVAETGTFSGTIALRAPREGLLLLARSEESLARSHPVTVRLSPTASDEEIHAVLLLAAGGGLRFRIVGLNGGAVPAGAALVTELPQTTFRKSLPIWERGGHEMCDRLVVAGEDGVIEIGTREGDIAIRVGESADGPFGSSRSARVQVGAVADLGDIPIPREIVTCVLRFEDEDGPVAARVRIEERTLRFGHPLSCDETYHFEVGADGVLSLDVPLEALPLEGAAVSERHLPIGFQVRAERETQRVSLRRRPSRSIRLLDRDGVAIRADVRWYVEHAEAAESRGDRSAPVRRGGSVSMRVVEEMTDDATVLAEAGAGSYTLVTKSPGRYRVLATLPGGLQVDATEWAAEKSLPPLVLRVPSGREREIRIVAQDPILRGHDHAYVWRFTWTAPGDDEPPLSYVVQASVNGNAVRMWIPDEYHTLELEESTSAFRSVGPLRVEDTDVAEVETELADGAAMARFVPSLGVAGRNDALALAGISVVVSGSKGGVRALTTNDDGVAAVLLPPGSYRVGLYPLSGPMAWRETVVQPSSPLEVRLPVR